MSDDNREALGRLIRQQLVDMGVGPSKIVEGWSAGPTRSFYWWMSGEKPPLPRSRAMLEDALGWKRGSVTEVLEAPITQEFTLSEVRDWGQAPPENVREVPAASASTHELLMEVMRRFGELSSEVERLEGELKSLRRVANGSPAKTHQDMFGLAAHTTDAGMNMEHLEDGD